MGKLTQKIIRWRWKVKVKYKKPALVVWRWITTVWYVLLCLFCGLFVAAGLFASAYEILIEKEPPDEMTRFMVPVVEGLNAYLPLDKALLWVVEIGMQIADSALWMPLAGLLLGSLWVIGIISLLILVLVVLWFLPEKIAGRKEEKAENRLEVLRVALRPVPSGRDVAIRFLVVTMLVWTGLNFVELFARRNGWCLYELNGDCTHTFISSLTWFSVAAGVGALSVWGMLKKRSERKAAKRKAMHMRETFAEKLGRAVKLVVWAAIVWVALFVFAVWLLEI